ncbi:CobW family GTP-binding protein [Prochlorococcus marinus]|uniref:Cobalamin synthesis protein/P47K n=1 Tax=Prochlorococcus marinus (strain MIT 9303) TaxID=59922 RepID=A2C8Q5_PROM3|nr:GTP-binding protein [Prochlorococcus marinus]ABM77865.1 Cobalamin synthesis protein/P47K [Prochlorococcus marinus str. MIT 9303]
MTVDQKVPVTILTGFLGSGKTTLLNRILSEKHGKRIAVIENEYGEVGIDQGLVINADEEVFEMSNGCICCTVRGDLIRVLGNLMKRRDKFDYVLVETTGLADPGPVAQTFFMDDEIRDEFSLDGIVTLVDAAHIQQQLGRSRESSEQVAFADVLILNKTDLVSHDSLDVLESRLRDMNRMARIVRSEEADVPVDTVLNLSAFDLDQVLAHRPTFLEPEYPFEWTGVFDLEEGTYHLSLEEGPDPTMSIVVLPNQATDERSFREGAEQCVRLYAQPAIDLEPGQTIPVCQHVNLQLQAEGQKIFRLEINRTCQLGLFTQHTADEFDIKVKKFLPAFNDSSDPIPYLSTTSERVWVAEHEHDDEVGSIAIECSGNVDPEKLNQWMGKLLVEKGVDIFRTKGFISYEGDSRRIVFQGVHMLFTAQPDREWGDEPRHNQLVFIGRKLDEESMREGFEHCLI